MEFSKEELELLERAENKILEDFYNVLNRIGHIEECKNVLLEIIAKHEELLTKIKEAIND